MPNREDGVTKLVENLPDAYHSICQARRSGSQVGLVPTMGALHEGHLSLVRKARADCDFTVVTIFVNPTQFGPGEDLDQYPRTIETDLEALRNLDVDLVVMPDSRDMYPPGFSTFVNPPSVAEFWEGEHRRTHFRGVTTIVLKLFNIIPADVAYFGQKDFQQQLVIRRMVEDLNVPMRIVTCPTVREADGLALSSRNRYLSHTERQQAVSLSHSLHLAQRMIEDGESAAAVVSAAMRNKLTSAGVTDIDYIAIVDPQTLVEIETIDGQVALLVAARVGETRLIDNHVIGDKHATDAVSH